MYDFSCFSEITRYSQFVRRMYESALYPSAEEEKKLFLQFKYCRKFHNICLQEQIDYHEKHGRYMTFFEQNASVKRIKKECPEYKDVHTHILADVVHRLVLALEAYVERKKEGKKGGFPHFKSMKKFKSITYIDAGNDIGAALVYENQDCEYKTAKTINNQNSKKIKNFLETGKEPKKAINVVSGKKRLRISGVGNVKIKIHREMLGKLKTITIKYKNGKWFAYFSRDEIEIKPLEKTGKTIAGDLGTLRFLTLSNGEEVPNPRFLIKAEEKLKRLQRSFSRKQEGSKNYREALYYLARAHEHVANCRKDFINKLVHYLVVNYDVIIMEDLNIQNMINGKFDKSIYDASWGIFLRKLAEAAEKTGKEFYKVNPAYTSQDCSECGYRDPIEKTLSDRVHHCNKCGHTEDRDLNAAKNILKKGIELKNKLDKEKIEAESEADSKTGREEPSCKFSYGRENCREALASRKCVGGGGITIMD